MKIVEENTIYNSTISISAADTDQVRRQGFEGEDCQDHSERGWTRNSNREACQ